MQRQTGMLGPRTRVMTTYHPPKGRQTDKTGDRGVSSEGKARWNPCNTWRAEVTVLGTER